MVFFGPVRSVTMDIMPFGLQHIFKTLLLKAIDQIASIQVQGGVHTVLFRSKVPKDLFRFFKDKGKLFRLIAVGPTHGTMRLAVTMVKPYHMPFQLIG